MTIIMTFAVVLFFSILYTVAASGNSDEFDPNVLNPDHYICGRLTNNTAGPAQLGKFPWLAYLEYNRPRAGSQKLRCLGSLINKRHVLTSAECVNKTGLMAVLIGGHDPHDEMNNQDAQHRVTRRYYIENIIMHANYSCGPLPRNDIALIRLNSTVHFSEHIRPVCLPDHEMQSPEPGESMTSSTMSQNMTSWYGVVNMQKVRSTLVSYRECSNHYSKLNLTVAPDHICTRTAYDSTYTCTNDHGGPMTHENREGQYMQAGIVSYERECDGYFPKINTKVLFFRDWIIKNMRMQD